MGRLNVNQVVMDPATACCCRERGIPLDDDTVENLMHRANNNVGIDELHNVKAELTIVDETMAKWLRDGIADIVCSHRRSGGYDGIEYPQYCRDEILRLTLRADNGSWVYRRSRPSSWFRDKATHWRWPD